MNAENTASGFPRANKVMDKIIASKETGLLKALGYTLLLIGAGMIDFPGAVIKSGKVLRERLKKPPST